MKSTGIVRKLDELGRVVLPVELRRMLEIEERDPLEISLEGDCIILRKFKPSCIFCSAEETVLEYRNKRVCSQCLQRLADAND